jgi:hypothetical protein
MRALETAQHNLAPVLDECRMTSSHLKWTALFESPALPIRFSSVQHRLQMHISIIILIELSLGQLYVQIVWWL